MGNTFVVDLVVVSRLCQSFVAFAVTFLFGWVGTATSQTYHWDCEFPTYASFDDGRWTTGSATDMNFQFVWNDGEALIIGNQGVGPVDFEIIADAFFFTEYTIAAKHITVIVKNGSAVHSRHIVVNGKIIAYQWQGGCDIR